MSSNNLDYEQASSAIFITAVDVAIELRIGFTSDALSFLKSFATRAVAGVSGMELIDGSGLLKRNTDRLVRLAKRRTMDDTIHQAAFVRALEGLRDNRESLWPYSDDLLS